MNFIDRYKFTQDQNVNFAEADLAVLVHTSSRFEEVDTNLSQTQAIINGLSVSGVSTHDIEVIINLKRGWNYILNYDDSIIMNTLKSINKVVAANDSLYPGSIRTSKGGVSIGDGDYFEPDLVNEKAEIEFLAKITASSNSTADSALTLMYHLMRGQLFWDGNKRTAVLAANLIMINGGAGLINVPLSLWEKWNELISDYYLSADMAEVKLWTYQNGIQGIDSFKV